MIPCKNCLNYIDDIIVYGKTESEHDECLRKALEVLENQNVLLNKKKCQFKAEQLEFLGHILTTSEIKADPRKVEVICSFRAQRRK